MHKGGQNRGEWPKMGSERGKRGGRVKLRRRDEVGEGGRRDGTRRTARLAAEARTRTVRECPAVGTDTVRSPAMAYLLCSFMNYRSEDGYEI